MNLSEMIDAVIAEGGDGKAVVSHLIDYGHLPPDADTRPAEKTARQCQFAQRATEFFRKLDGEKAGAPA